jgi:RNA polymerase sigma-70 factor (ECF subfamily)
MIEAPYKDSEAFSQLYEMAHLTVFRYVYSLHGGPQEEVEDLTADTFWRAWKARKRFNGNQKAAVSWLLKIARRLVIDSFRRQNSRGYTTSLDKVDITDEGDWPEDKVHQNEQIAILIQLLQELPVEQREILILRYILGWRVKDIGAHLEIAENTISVTIRRTLEKLRNQWPESTCRG